MDDEYVLGFWLVGQFYLVKIIGVVERYASVQPVEEMQSEIEEAILRVVDERRIIAPTARLQIIAGRCPISLTFSRV